ncbi:hypothetical protein SUGI_0885070 [Cryptomeria japonica]|nr:hypothetical protein SUGI_0885070 [Cryptomeria japonica]
MGTPQESPSSPSPRPRASFAGLFSDPSSSANKTHGFVVSDRVSPDVCPSGFVSRVNGCLPQVEARLKIVKYQEMIEESIDYKKNHDLICKFSGFRPSISFLHSWIRSNWEPLGEYSLWFIGNGYFIVSFSSLVGRAKAFESDKRHYGPVDLFIQPWKVSFDPRIEPTAMPVWIRIICVETNLSLSPPAELELVVNETLWIQQLDFEALSFRCRVCHKHGHLARFCPTSQALKPEHSDLNPSSYQTQKTSANQHPNKPSTREDPPHHGFVRQRKKKELKNKDSLEQPTMDITPYLISNTLENTSHGQSPKAMPSPKPINVQQPTNSFILDVSMGVPEKNREKPSLGINQLE